MNNKGILTHIKRGWKWIWHSDSIWSWLVALAIIFILVKFIFFPGLSLIMGTNLPLSGVESSSMDHSPVKQCEKYSSDGKCTVLTIDYELCGNSFQKKESVNFEKYWNNCGGWYENKGITKEQFLKFSLKNGFNKGDVIITWGRFTPKIGDVIIFQPNQEATRSTPIIHRIIKINDDGTLQTKGDHNGAQLTKNLSPYVDETSISKKQIIGKAIIKIPYLGWFKIWAVDIVGFFF